MAELNSLRTALCDADLLCSVVLTQDSHPSDHISFQKNNPGSELFKEHVLACGNHSFLLTRGLIIYYKTFN